MSVLTERPAVPIPPMNVTIKSNDQRQYASTEARGNRRRPRTALPMRMWKFPFTASTLEHKKVAFLWSPGDERCDPSVRRWTSDILTNSPTLPEVTVAAKTPSTSENGSIGGTQQVSAKRRHDAGVDGELRAITTTATAGAEAVNSPGQRHDLPWHHYIEP